MAPLKNLNTYFQNMETLYPDSQWKDYTTQATLNHGIINAMTALDPNSNDKFVTQLAFDAVEGVVYLCLDDWPKAAGSVWNMCKTLWKKFFHTGVEEEITAVLQNYPNYPNVTEQQLQTIREAVITRITNKINNSGGPIIPRVDALEDLIITLTTEINGLKQRVQALENNN